MEQVKFGGNIGRMILLFLRDMLIVYLIVNILYWLPFIGSTIRFIECYNIAAITDQIFEIILAAIIGFFLILKRLIYIQLEGDMLIVHRVYGEKRQVQVRNAEYTVHHKARLLYGHVIWKTQILRLVEENGNRMDIYLPYFTENNMSLLVEKLRQVR